MAAATSPPALACQRDCPLESAQAVPFACVRRRRISESVTVPIAINPATTPPIATKTIRTTPGSISTVRHRLAVNGAVSAPAGRHDTSGFGPSIRLALDRRTDDSGSAMSSSDIRSAFTPITSATTPPMAITAAPMK